MWKDFLGMLTAATPGRCEVCRAWPAQPLCSACEARFVAHANRCCTCAARLPEGLRACGRCLQAAPPLDACHAAVSYGYPWSELIGRFKFSAEAGWAATFARLLAARPGVGPCVAAARWVLPMPLSRERLAVRGFNQAHELARRLAPDRADAGILLRLRDAPPQAALDRAARQANVRHAFAIEPARAADVRGASVVLVDDVMTSGASLYALAGVLRAAGAVAVSAVVLARTEDA
jgi:ComF family protein